MNIYFIGKDDGPTIEECITHCKAQTSLWKSDMYCLLQDDSILQVHGCIQKEKVIISINPSCKHNFINVNLEKKLQFLSKPTGGW